MSDIKPSRRGLLHQSLGVPMGKKIPLSTLMRAKIKAKDTGDTNELKRVVYAENVRK